MSAPTVVEHLDFTPACGAVPGACAEPAVSVLRIFHPDADRPCQVYLVCAGHRATLDCVIVAGDTFCGPHGTVVTTTWEAL